MYYTVSDNRGTPIILLACAERARVMAFTTLDESGRTVEVWDDFQNALDYMEGRYIGGWSLDSASGRSLSLTHDR